LDATTDMPNRLFTTSGYVPPGARVVSEGPFWWIECYGCGDIHPWPTGPKGALPSGWSWLYPIERGTTSGRARDENNEALPDVYSSKDCLKKAIKRAQEETGGAPIRVRKQP
jgi:hypothetical protein